MAESGIMVEPPEGAKYVTAAYAPGTLEPNRLAWVQAPPAHAPSPAAGQETLELAKRPRVANKADDAERPWAGNSLIGIVYADSPIEDRSTSARPLAAVSVVVSGLVTLVDAAFADKATCGQFVFADADTGTLAVAAVKPSGARYWTVGMLLETGSRCDARVLLGIEPPQ